MVDKNRIVAKLSEYAPYFHPNSGIGVITVSAILLQDIYELLKPTPPKMLTLNEALNLPGGTVVWKDDRDESEMWPIVPVCLECVGKRTLYDSDDPDDFFVFTDGYDYVSDYGKAFVFWDQRPTETQRKEAKFGG